MGAILDGADDVSVHAITVVARVVGRDEIAVIVSGSVQQTAELPGGNRSRGRVADDDVRVAFIADWTANTFDHDGVASVDLEDALLHDASCVVADAVAEFARIVGIGRHLSSVAVEQSVDHAAFRFAQGNVAGRRNDRRRPEGRHSRW